MCGFEMEVWRCLATHMLSAALSTRTHARAHTQTAALLNFQVGFRQNLHAGKAARPRLLLCIVASLNHCIFCVGMGSESLMRVGSRFLPAPVSRSPQSDTRSWRMAVQPRDEKCAQHSRVASVPLVCPPESGRVARQHLHLPSRVVIVFAGTGTASTATAASSRPWAPCSRRRRVASPFPT